MSTPTHKLRIYTFCLSLFLILVLANNASASVKVEVDDISVNVYPGEIKPGDDFKVGITFENPNDNDDADVDVQIWVGSVLVHEKTYGMDFTEGNDTELNISSEDFRVDGDDLYNGNLMNYKCDDNIEVKATVSGEVNEKSDSTDSLDVAPEGDEDEKTLQFSLDPENPQIDEEMTIKVTDNNDDGVQGARVRFTWIDDNTDNKWEENDDTEDASNTDNDGETTFNIADDMDKEEYGNYQIDVYREGYCKATETLSIVEGELTVGNPEPASPKIGEQFKLKVTDGTKPIKGAKGFINELGVYATSTSKEDGYLTFTISKSGTFTIFINASGYGGMEKQVTVSSKPPLTIVITPTPQEISTPVTIAVMSDSNSVSGVTLTILKPESGKDVKATGSDGKVSYTPDKVGSYTVTASKEGYQNSTEVFVVNSGFVIQTNPSTETVPYGTEVTLTVIDAATRIPVIGALISGTGVSYGTRTNAMGQYVVRLEASGQYNFLVSKDGYSDKGVSIMALCGLEVKINSTSTTSLSSGQSVLVRVYDKEKKDFVSGNIVVTKPDGSSDTKVGTEYVLTPVESGTYKISVSKANCNGDEKSFDVNKNQITFETEIKDGQLVVRTVSSGKPLSGVKVEITAPSGIKLSDLTSGDDGFITINAPENGNYTIVLSDGRYTAQSISIEKQSSILKRYWWAILIAVIVFLILLLLLIVVVMMLRSRGGRKESSFGSGSGSKLGG